MHSLLVAVIAISASVWVGAIVFQSAVVAPTVFACLDEAASRRLLRGLFPRFFRLGAGCAIVMLAGAAGLLALFGSSTSLAWVAGAALCMLLLATFSLALVPRINAARDAGASGSALFHRLHRLSVLLTVAGLLLGIAVVAGLSATGLPLSGS